MRALCRRVVGRGGRVNWRLAAIVLPLPWKTQAVTPDGGPLMPRNLKRRHFRPILERAKLPQDFRLYDLRHSCATLLLAAGEHPKVVSERLGHATVTLTLDVYSHVLPTMQEAATEKLERMLFAG